MPTIERVPKSSARTTAPQPGRRSSLYPLKRLLLAGLLVLIFGLLLARPARDVSALVHGAEGPKTALILTAHPDDEVMFFTPTIVALLSAGWEVRALCLSTGASYMLQNYGKDEAGTDQQGMEMVWARYGRRSSSGRTKSWAYQPTMSPCLIIRGCPMWARCHVRDCGDHG